MALELRWQPQFDLSTESCSRQEFGWLTVELPKIMPCIMLYLFKLVSNGNFTGHCHLPYYRSFLSV